MTYWNDHSNTLNARQLSRVRALSNRLAHYTCRIYPVSLTCEIAAPDQYGSAMVMLKAQSADERGIFHGVIMGLLGPRGGFKVTHESFDVY